MQLKHVASALLVISLHALAHDHAQYGPPEFLKAEMTQGNDLVLKFLANSTK